MITCKHCGAEFLSAGSKGFAEQCPECGYYECECGEVFPHTDAESTETRTGYDWDCPFCERRINSADIWPE